MKKNQISVQLYTVRQHTDRDFAGTLGRIAEFGYAGVELAGYGSLGNAAAVAKAVAANGLTVSGAHVMIEPLLADPHRVVGEQADYLGNRLIIVPWIGLDGKGIAEYQAFASQLGKVAEVVTKAGATLAYHNHSFELRRFAGHGATDGMDVIFGSVPADQLKAELDMFWVVHGGHDPVKYLKKFDGRVVAIHVKDMEIGPDRRFANVGEGIIDYVPIFAAAKAAGVRWFVVEQDDCYGQDSLEAVAVSFRNLQKAGLV